MVSKLLCIAAAAETVLATAAGVFGQSPVMTDPVGISTASLLGNSDTYVSIPFTRAPEFLAAISSAASSGTAGIITVAGNPWIANQLVYGGTQHNHYYALIGPITGTGTKEGHIYLITGNGSAQGKGGGIFISGNARSVAIHRNTVVRQNHPEDVYAE